MHFSLVIPVFNEGGKIQRDICAAYDFLSKQPYPSEVIIVDDGSQDGTRAAADKYVARYEHQNPSFRVFGYTQNHGKGYAVRYGFNHATGANVGFVDSGLCIPLPYVKTGLRKLDEGFDYAIASRRLPEAKIVHAQPLYRRLGSRAFRVVARFLMGIDVSDSQCGLKLFRANVAAAIFGRVKSDGFMFDIEALCLAKKLGFKGAEFGVEWSHDDDTRYRPVLGTVKNFWELMDIRLRV